MKPTQRPAITDQKPKLKTFDFYSRSRIMICVIIAVYGFILYINTIPHDFTFDDVIVITRNEFTKKGLSGIAEIMSTDYLAGMYGKDFQNMYEGGRYRPLSIVTFAIEYQFFGENPHINHFVNALLYALTGIFIFLVLTQLFADKKYYSLLIHENTIPKTAWLFSIPFLATMLYMSHPLHTEVVASIKGRDEIMSLLGSFITVWLALKYAAHGKSNYLLWCFVAFFLALLSKENAVAFVFIIPLTIYYFSDSVVKDQIVKPNSKSVTSKFSIPTRSFLVLIPLVSATLLFLILRQSAIAGVKPGIEANLMTNPFLEASLGQRYATIFYTLGLYIKLLFVPHPLTFDYYPYHIPLISPGDLRAIVPLLVYLALGIYALIKIERKDIISYSIWFYLATFALMSNVLFNIGVFMSERFMYAASLGFCIAVIFILVDILPKFLSRYTSAKTILGVSFALIMATLVVFSYLTVERNKAWKDNKTLFATDVKTSSNSLKSTAAAGELLLFKARKVPADSLEYRKQLLTEAITYFTTTVKVYPGYVNVLMYLGEAHLLLNRNYTKAFEYYSMVFDEIPNYPQAVKAIDDMMKAIDDVDFKIAAYEKLYKKMPNSYDVNYNLGTLYGAFKQDVTKAIPYLESAVTADSSKANAFTDLGVAYGISNQFTKSAAMFEKALALSPNDKQIMTNLAHSYQQLGMTDKAKIYRNMAAQQK